MGSRAVVRDTALVFGSTLAINIATAALLALSGVILPEADFAGLCLLVATVMLATAFFDLGLNVAMTKGFGDTGDENYLRSTFAVRIAAVLGAGVMGVGVGILAAAPLIGWGIALGGLLSFWNGIRACDQARSDYVSYGRASIVFMLIRGGFGLAALYATGDPVIIGIAAYGAPVVASLASTSLLYARQAFSAGMVLKLGFVGYAGYVYLNALALVALPYMPQFAIASRLDATAVGTYGLILTFTAPISLVIYSLRSVLLPRMLGPGHDLENLLWSRRAVVTIAFAYAAALICGAGLAFALNAIYSARFPEIGEVFMLYFAGFSATALIGLWSLSLHTLNVPHYGTFFSIGRLLLLAVLLATVVHSLETTILATVGAMFAGELMQVGMLAWRRKGN